ncbi:hypothetical protein Bca101_064485 [Brassica carinata]
MGQVTEQARTKRRRADGPSDGQIKLNSHGISYGECEERDSKVDCSVQALTWEAIGSWTWESAGVRNRENEMKNNRISDGDVEMKIDGEVEIQRYEASE